MSSKIHKGGAVPTETPSWHRVSPLDVFSGDSQAPGAGFLAAPNRQTADVEHRIQQAHQHGYEEGRAESQREYASAIEAMQVKLARTIEEITGLRPRYRREAEQDVVALALAVAHRILHRELTVSPDALLGLVKAALEKMEAREVNRVRVARQDAPLVQAFFEKMGLPHRIEVVADAVLAPASVVLESDRGSLDASVGAQLSEIERGFADLVRRAE
jgi:flagellar assembly protein FliH